MLPQPAEIADCRLLFVYGTLRRGFELHHHLARLGARFQAEAKVPGRLFDLGRFPGARPADREQAWVHGEVFELRQSAADLEVLDEVEGFTPGTPEQSEFVRAITVVVLNDGARQSCWIYWLGPGQGSHRRIASGDYAEWRSRGAVT
jgi:gamma-glutamylcyclotransferase (GGCT)/AIG2-like uncharacterized protein YtfP